MSNPQDKQAKQMQEFLFEDMAPRPEKQKGRKKLAHPERGELLKIRDYYLQHIRSASTSVEQRGVVRQMEALLDKGFTTKQLWLAVKNYEKDEFRRAGDKRFTKTIRGFFNADTVVLWQAPVQRKKDRERPVDPSIAALARLAEAEPVAIPLPQPEPEPEPDEDEEFSL